ncbi:uncharacterized protein LOC143002364 [Genypterus blacodes]|uniref:uncharacterized protein LOC143002364 n=1 Tax=Genypterus blacodes TaxID=154954 RepID=UPI003F76160C
MEEEIEIPPLTRTDSVFLTKEMLGYESDLSHSSIASSEDEYVPASSEASSDEPSERSRQKHRPKTSSESKGGSAGLSGAKKKKRGREASVHAREEDSDESRLKTKKRYKRSDKRCSRSSEEEDSGESILKTKRRYKKGEKRGTISPVEGEPDDSASIKRKKNRKTYSRHEKSTISISVKTSDSLVIADVPKVDGCKKYHQKRNYCLYCRKPQTKIARHLERKHRDKSEVASAIMYAKKSKERRNQLDLLRKQGNRAHNIDALTKGEGTLVPCKQQSDGKSSPKDYQHCFACFGYFKRNSLWKHAKRCSLAQSVRRTLPGKTRIQALCASAQPVPKDVNMKVWALVNGMTQDEITHAVKEDIYIMKVGEKMYNRQRETARFRGSDCIRELAKNCGAEKPEALSSTKLRRQVATLSRVLNLNDTEQDLLADFLGHDIRVHRKFYRLPEGTLQLAKISKVLMACEQGRLAEFKGKSLDQISISPNDQSEVMEESSGESSEDEDHPATPAGEEPVARGKEGTSKQQLGQKRGSGGGASVTPHKQQSVEEQSSGCAKKGRRMWSAEEVKAVEKSMMEFVRMGKTPGKQDCERCIAASPEVLAHRDWKGVKFFVYNRILSDQRL